MGNPVNMNKLKSLSKKYKLYLLEDCALAVGAKIDNKHVGLFGDAGFFFILSSKTHYHWRRRHDNSKKS